MCDLRGQLSQDYERLTDEISRRARHTGIYFSSLPGLRFIRRDDPSRLENVLFPPSICLVAQGLKRALKYNVDTLARSGVRFGDELGVGIAVKGGEKWTAEFNYLRSDWRNSGFDRTEGFAVSGGSVFSSTVSQSFRAGFEFVPNRNDIRYYLRRCSYRAGVYYDQAYYKFDGNNVNSMGITLGITLPVFRWYNGITLGVDIGQRASTKNPDMIRERYANFVIGFNIHDIWFRKVQYQ